MKGNELYGQIKANLDRWALVNDPRQGFPISLGRGLNTVEAAFQLGNDGSPYQYGTTVVNGFQLLDLPSPNYHASRRASVRSMCRTQHRPGHARSS